MWQTGGHNHARVYLPPAAASARGLAKLTTGRREAFPAGFLRVGRKLLGVGRPDRIQLLVDRRVLSGTPGRFGTRIIADGILPGLHVEYKVAYSKDGRARCTETTLNDTYDFLLEGI